MNKGAVPSSLCWFRLASLFCATSLPHTSTEDSPLIAVLLFISFAVGCPLIMIFGIGYGCRRYLTIRETQAIVRDYFLE